MTLGGGLKQWSTKTVTSKSQPRLRECSASNPKGCRFALIHRVPQWKFEFWVLLGRHHPIVIIAPSVGSELSKIVDGSPQSALRPCV